MRRLLCLALLLVPATAFAQKRALTQADWDRWNSITGSALSNDGRWIAYSIAPLVGNGDLVIRSTSGATEHRVPRGYLGRPNNVPGGLRPRSTGTEEDPAGPTIAPAQITADSRFALALTYPPQAEFDRVANDRRQTSALQNRSALAIVRLADGNVTTIERVRSFRLPRHSGAWVAYVPADSTSGDSTARREGEGGGRGSAQRGTGPRRRYGSALVLRELATGTEHRLDDVLDYAFDDSAKVFAYTVVSRTAGRDGAFVRHLATGTTATMLSGAGDYNQVAVDRAGMQVAFVANRDDFGRSGAYTLYHGTVKEGVARPAVAPAALGGDRVVETANVSFTRAGNAVIFGIGAPLVDTLPADSLVNKSVFDLWHYKDRTLQPAQRLTASRDRNRAFQATYQVATRRLTRLANDSIPTVSIADDGRVALGNSRERYAISSMWGDAGTDVYLIDGQTGRIRLLAEKITGSAQLSPDAKYVVWYDDEKWFAHGTATGRTVEMSAPLTAAGVVLADETHDVPSPRPAWGPASWTKDDRSVLVYDRYDIWELDPAGTRPPVMVTDSAGRRSGIEWRLAIGGTRGGFGGGGGGGGTPSDERGIDPAKPLLLRGVNDDTKAQAFARDQLGVRRAPEILVQADAAFGQLTKATDAEQYLVTKGTFVEFPDLYTGSSPASLTKVSNANPQQKDYLWGTVELVRWHSADGVPLKGLLYKPEGFDPARKYPMIVYHYEQMSQNLHTYVPPNGRNVTNASHYASNGWLVFMPDIHYEIGYPGPSALKSIVPGVNALIARGFVDPGAIGIQGQSWGGYQGLYMITQTHIFNAAVLGAPVVNMTSAYGGIRWGSGLARSFQYEVAQSRIGGSIWQTPMRYFENSPLFWLDKVTTPVFFMHNDADDAVPWYQGIEAFVGLRRLGKEVYLINYNNDVHNPQSRANQKDMAMRMEQFFDHHLRGKPAPDWMRKGIPYLSKGRDQVPGTMAPIQAGEAKP